MDQDQAGVTVAVAARRAGLTVRTLHHWDHIGLVHPSRTSNGYRLYTEADQARLERVAAYQRAGLTLDEITRLLNRDPSQLPEAISEQRQAIARRIAALQELDEHLSQVDRAHRHGWLLDSDEQLDLFGPTWHPDHTTRAHERWHDSPQWAQFAERSAARTRDEWQTIAEHMRALETDLATAMKSGVPSDSPEGRQLAERHRQLFSQFFPITHQMQVCLGRMYATDPAFTAYYDQISPGLTNWLQQAINASARHRGIDPAQATWD